MSTEFEGIMDTATKPVDLAGDFARNPHAQSEVVAPVAFKILGDSVIAGGRSPVVDTFTRSSDQTVDPASSTSNTGEHDPHKRGTSNYTPKGPAHLEDHLGQTLDVTG